MVRIKKYDMDGNLLSDSGAVGPSTVQMGVNAFSALRRFVTAEQRFADEDTANERKRICESCQFWKPDARLGLGKCNHHSCGCTKLKWKIASESCPIGKWGRVDMTS